LMMASNLRRAVTISTRHLKTAQTRTFAGGKPKLPFGLDKILGEPDNLIPLDKDRKSKKGTIPDYAPPEIKKDLEELGLDGIEDLDEMEEPEIEAAEMAIEELCTGSSWASIPATNLLQIRAGYDDGFLAKVGGSAAQAEAYIKSALTHAQVSYCHASLGTKIHIQRIGNIKHYSGRSLQATGAKLEEMKSTTEADLGTADLMMYMGYELDLYGTVGIAYVSTVCGHPNGNGYKQSINEWRPTLTAAGHVIAHEIGHNLGMKHDFSTSHDASGCNGKGIMSYGDPPNQWSACSKNDFQAHYITNKSRWCMELASTACDGSGTVPPTTAPTPPPPPPAKATCDLSQIFGNQINGNIMLQFSVNGQLYTSNLNCKNSVCSPNVSGITNACQYICGGNTCP